MRAARAAMVIAAISGIVAAVEASSATATSCSAGYSICGCAMSIAYSGAVSSAATAWFSCVQLSSILVAGLSSRHIGPRHAAYRRAGALRRVASARHRDAGRHLHGASHLHDRHAAARARHRRQRLAVPRPHGSVAVAAIEPPGRRRNDLAGGTAPRCRFHHRQSVLVVQHGGKPRHRRDAAADLPRRRPQAAGLLHQAARAARRIDGAIGPVPVVPFLGPGDVDRGVALDRRCRAACPAHAVADADAGLSSASRLRPAALRSRTTRASPQACARSMPWPAT